MIDKTPTTFPKVIRQFDLVRFVNEIDGGPVHRVVSVMHDGMVELHDMGGYFAPHLFAVADDVAAIPPDPPLSEIVRLRAAVAYCLPRLKLDAYKKTLNAILRGDKDESIRNPDLTSMVASAAEPLDPDRLREDSDERRRMEKEDPYDE
jgi:hypothetical protein